MNYSPTPEQVAIVDASEDRVAELEHQLRAARFDADHWRRQADAIGRNVGRHRDELDRTIQRVCGLIDRRRKTVRTADLIAALEGGDPQ